jgi:putative ABC transport system ATP-binding protein
VLAAFVEKLVKVYGKPGTSVSVQALRGVDIEFVQGESVAICGQSGSGKSTLMNLLGCLDRPTSGRFVLGDMDVSELDDDALSDIRGQRIGFVFQSFNLIPQLTLLENLEVPLFYQGCPPRTRREKAQRLVEMVELGDRGEHRPTELSGGQQQRAAIARALINDPILVLADEPTGNLDSATGQLILGIFDRLRDEGKTIVMVTHDANVARRCDRIITLRDGRVVDDHYTHIRTIGSLPEPANATAAI